MGSHIANLTGNWLMADRYFHPCVYDLCSCVCTIINFDSVEHYSIKLLAT